MAKVLNGEVQAGDRVAYATRSGSWMGMHIGQVVEIVQFDRTPYWSDGPVTVTKLKLTVEQSSDSFSRLPRAVTIGELDRVVKL